MSDDSELIELERDAWKALSTSGRAATSYYDDRLAENVLVLLPGGMVIDDRDVVVESMGGDPWTWYELHDERVLRLGEAGAVVAYRVEAQRGEFAYHALLNSTYVRESDDWKLALHQQTPIED